MSEPEGRGGVWTDEPVFGEEGRRRANAPRRRANQPTQRANQQTPPGDYAEYHCALSWPLLAVGIAAPAGAVAIFTAGLIAEVPAVSWAGIVTLFLAAAGWAACGGAWLPYVWPTGLKLDADGVRIGGLRWAQRHPGRSRARTAIVPRQFSQVFSCPWQGVAGVGVTTDRAAIGAMRKHAYRGRKPTPLGNLAVPYMRAALVVVVDTEQAQLPSIRPAMRAAWSNNSAAGYHQPVWVAPVRHPDRLKAVLELLPLPAGTLRDAADLLGEEPWPT